MRKQIIIGIILFLLPVVYGVSVGTGVGVGITPGDANVDVWMNTNGRLVLDDGITPGRISANNETLVERTNNYAFEGEKILWHVLVYHPNGLGAITSVDLTVGDIQGDGNPPEAACTLATILAAGADINAFNVRRGLQDVSVVPADEVGLWFTYNCFLTVESPASMDGEMFVTVEATDNVDNVATADENEFWFFNPIVALSISGNNTMSDLIDFGEVAPGELGYSNTVVVSNEAETGSGVTLDMFISGTDFTDSTSSGTLCPTSNLLALTNFRYFATNGAYSSASDSRNTGGVPLGNGTAIVVPDAIGDDLDENYVRLALGNQITSAREMICDGVGTNARDLNLVATDGIADSVTQCGYNAVSTYSDGNQLTPGSDMVLKFRLDLPAPCVGDFDTGNFFFWGEAV